MNNIKDSTKFDDFFYGQTRIKNVFHHIDLLFQSEELKFDEFIELLLFKSDLKKFRKEFLNVFEPIENNHFLSCNWLNQTDDILIDNCKCLDVANKLRSIMFEYKFFIELIGNTQYNPNLLTDFGDQMRVTEILENTRMKFELVKQIQNPVYGKKTKLWVLSPIRRFLYAVYNEVEILKNEKDMHDLFIWLS